MPSPSHGPDRAPRSGRTITIVAIVALLLVAAGAAMVLDRPDTATIAAPGATSDATPSPSESSAATDPSPTPSDDSTTAASPSEASETATQTEPAEDASPTPPAPGGVIQDQRPAAPAQDLSTAELAAIGANEAGRVLVMEWHKIQDADGRWENSMATFRAQLQELYDRNYRPVSTEEFISGEFPIPAGTSPVLLTFDDSYKEHMFFGPDGQTASPDSVVGIMEEMQANDPTWRTRGTFAYYWPVPFRETDPALIREKMRYMVETGFDLSNHSYNHDDLSTLTEPELVENLAKAEIELDAMVPGYTVRSLTLPQGIWPENRDLAVAGEFDDFSYQHDVVLLVGFMPTRSPNHVEYDGRGVQRVQAYVPEFRKWVDWMDGEPGRRFVSDGDPTTVTYPESFTDVAKPVEGQTARTYPDPDAEPTAEPTS